jgi:hypothetical protein
MLRTAALRAPRRSFWRLTCSFVTCCPGTVVHSHPPHRPIASAGAGIASAPQGSIVLAPATSERAARGASRLCSMHGQVSRKTQRGKMPDMTRRRVLLLGSVAVIAALAVALWIIGPLDRITRERAAQILPGTSLKQANAILGQGQLADEQMRGAAGENVYVWQGSLGTVRIAFRGDLTSTDPAEFTEAHSLRVRIRHWFGL